MPSGNKPDLCRYMASLGQCVNTLRPKQNGRYFADVVSIAKAFSCMQYFALKCVPYDRLTKKMFMKWPGAEQATTHQLISPWCRIYASVNWISIDSGNGLSPIRGQVITWTSAHLPSIEPLGTNFSEIRIQVQNFSFKKMHFKMSSVKWQPRCARGDELTTIILT